MQSRRQRGDLHKGLREMGWGKAIVLLRPAGKEMTSEGRWWYKTLR